MSDDGAGDADAAGPARVDERRPAASMSCAEAVTRSRCVTTLPATARSTGRSARNERQHAIPSAVERGILDHPLHQLVERDARMCCELGHQRRLGHAGLRIDLEARPVPPSPRCGRRSGSPHGSRPGSPARDAPPAIVFGPLGKQTVKLAPEAGVSSPLERI